MPGRAVAPVEIAVFGQVVAVIGVVINTHIKRIERGLHEFFHIVCIERAGVEGQRANELDLHKRPVLIVLVAWPLALAIFLQACVKPAGFAQPIHAQFVTDKGPAFADQMCGAMPLSRDKRVCVDLNVIIAAILPGYLFRATGFSRPWIVDPVANLERLVDMAKSEIIDMLPQWLKLARGGKASQARHNPIHARMHHQQAILDSGGLLLLIYLVQSLRQTLHGAGCGRALPLQAVNAQLAIEQIDICP